MNPGLQQQSASQAAQTYKLPPVAYSRLQSQSAAEQQQPFQQIPFLQQATAPAQPAAKPKLFVPGESTVSRHTLASNSQHVGPAQEAAAKQHQPPVSSRLSALKARLDSEKSKAGNGNAAVTR